jgi:hypothetical protein
MARRRTIVSYLTVDITEVDSDLRKGLETLRPILPLRFSTKTRQYNVSFQRSSDPPAARVEGSSVTIRYSQPAHAFRLLGILAGQIKRGRPLESLEEVREFSLVSVMLDVSRNASPKLETLKRLLMHLALMGINGFMLYAETNYEIPGEPYWGHNTGRYGIGELRELDRFAADLGIEMIPCIQTLAHLRRALHWEAYNGVKDTETVMMVDESATYALIEKMIKAAAKPFGSRRIHIGMDEAWDLGLGAYLKKNGYTKPYDLMKSHLKQVLAILSQYDLKPMMWADMFFRAGSQSGAYYDRDVTLSKSIKSSIPKSVSLVYWDYYHFDEPTYLYWIDRHLELVPKDRLVMAPGAQTWNRFWTHYPYAFSTIRPAVAACRKRGIKDIVLTAWGDDGNECDLYSMLPALQFFADQVYAKKFDFQRFTDNLFGSCGIEHSQWESAGMLDSPPFLKPNKLQNNISKALLWEDPLYGILQPNLEGLPLRSHFEELASKLEASAKKPGNKGRPPLDRRLRLPHLLARILAVKCDLPARLYGAYQKNDRETLDQTNRTDLPFLRREITRLWHLHRQFWHETYKAHGWETLENRYGGLLARLHATQLALERYLSGKIDCIEELEGRRLKMLKLSRGELPTLRHAACYTGTPSAVN